MHFASAPRIELAYGDFAMPGGYEIVGGLEFALREPPPRDEHPMAASWTSMAFFRQPCGGSKDMPILFGIGVGHMAKVAKLHA